jgi:hypothetical protein
MLTLTAAVMSEHAIREAVLFLNLVIYIHNAFFHGANETPYEIGRARLRSHKLRDQRI